jgi:uncharacterized protein YjiS (DUF1127 family)
MFLWRAFQCTKRVDGFCRRYGLGLPILQAPMASAGPTKLAAAVASAGGIRMQAWAGQAAAFARAEPPGEIVQSLWERGKRTPAVIHQKAVDREEVSMLSINRSQELVYRLRHRSDRNRFKFGLRVTRRILQIAKSARQRLGCWIDRSAERQRLADMSDRELKDIGITRTTH